ncbi:MAG: hypothetical protein IT458_10390 [Planctomycetes bacterium]|nr:hypothetical protein [Planctomycetota bacterium]
MLPSLAILAAFAPPLPVPQDPVAWWLEALRGLARADARDGTFGPTGRRFWVTRLEARPGLQGQAHYVHHTPELTDPLVVEFLDPEGRPLELEADHRRWLPSHGEVGYRVRGHEDARVHEERWLTLDDVYVSRFTVRGLERFGVRTTSRFAEEPAGDLARFAPHDLGPAARVDLLRDPRLRTGGADQPVWIEGEAHRSQRGARGRDRKSGASGGEVLGNEFGGRKGDRAVYEFLGTGTGRWSLLVRYARDLPGEARFAVRFRGVEVGTVGFPRTMGWGFRPDQLAFARLDLGDVPDGLCELELEALHDGANTNIDGLLLLPTGQVGSPPPPERWPALDPLRGAVAVAPGPLTVGGVPFAIPPRPTVCAVDPEAHELTIGGRGARLHVLALALRPEASIQAGGVTRRLGPRGRGPHAWLQSLPVPGEGPVALQGRGCLILAATREAVASAGGPDVRAGRARFHGVDTEVQLTAHGLADPLDVRVPAGGEARFCVALEWSGPRRRGLASAVALAGDDPLGAHEQAYARWFADLCPRFTSADPFLARLWVYRCFLLRHNLAWPDAGYLRGPVFYEGRHGSWYPRVITFSTPHIVAEARWLRDPGLFQANLWGHVASQGEDGILRNVLVDWRGFHYTHWIASAVVDGFLVHPDRPALERAYEVLRRDVEGSAAAFDRDGDGLLAPDDHYSTGMEFQPSFWFFDGFDNTRPQTRLERPDFNAYHAANAQALAGVARALGRGAEAERLAGLAARTVAALERDLWDQASGFYYSVREADQAKALCKEVVGFYPFRFGIPADDAAHARAFAALLDPAQFWTAFPPASCSREVPVFSATVQRWPGPGGVVTACMWNGPTWPHAASLVADAMALQLRRQHRGGLEPRHLGEFLRRFARFHCESGNPSLPLLREYGDGETGVNWGCADYLHSTFLDLLVRHLGGLVPRADGVLEVRPLPLELGEFAFEDLPYHGHRIGLAVRSGRLRVTVDDRQVGEGDARIGLFLDGVLAR